MKSFKESINLEENMSWKVEIEGLPHMYFNGRSAGAVKNELRKILKSPGQVIKSITRVTPTEIKKDFRLRLTDKNDLEGEPVEEAVDIDTELDRREKQTIRQIKGLEEGRMKEFHGYMEQGKSAQWIAKKMRLDLKTVQALMKESVMKEAQQTFLEAIKTTHVVIDTAQGNKVISTASNEKGAKSSIVSAERPPMSIKDKRTLKVVKLKRPVSVNKNLIGYPLKEEVEQLDELTAAEKKLINMMYDKKGNLTPMGKKVMAHGKANSKLTPGARDADNARRKDYKAYQKSMREAVDASDTGGEEEVSMVKNQMKQIRHYIEGIENMVAKDGDIEEWAQNKLTKATDYLKSVYGYKTGKVEESTDAERQADNKKKDAMTSSDKTKMGAIAQMMAREKEKRQKQMAQKAREKGDFDSAHKHDQAAQKARK